MKAWLLKVVYFFHITDGKGQLDLTDLSFMLVIAKIMLSPGIDWTAVCALVPVILSQMHQRQVESRVEIHSVTSTSET